jgi:hypothetical protein
MTGILIFGGTILLLVLALEPAERRLRKWAPRQRGNAFGDRDWQRVQGELQSRIPAPRLKRRLAGVPGHRHHTA